MMNITHIVILFYPLRLRLGALPRALQRLKNGSLLLMDTASRQSMTEAATLPSMGAFSHSFNLVHDLLESLQIVDLSE